MAGCVEALAGVVGCVEVKALVLLVLILLLVLAPFLFGKEK